MKMIVTDTWQEITKIGTAMTIQNKTDNYIRVLISASEPTDDVDRLGYVLGNREKITYTENGKNVYVILNNPDYNSWIEVNDLGISGAIDTRTDEAGRKGLNTVFGQQIVGTEKSAFNSLFAYPSDTRKLQAIVANGGVVTQENFMLKLSTGIDANGSAIASSKRSLQYQPGKEGYAKFTSVFTQGVANSRQMMGLFDELNGFAVGLEGTDFAIFRKRNGSIVETVTQANFNGDKLDGNGASGFAIDITKGNIFRISFGYLGFATITFEILAGLSGWVTFHQIDYANKNIQTHITLPYLKLRAQVENFGNTSNISIYSGSVEAGVVDGLGNSTSAREFSIDGIENYTTPFLDNFIVFHNKATYGGVSNRVETIVKLLTLANEGTKTIRFRRVKLAVPPTSATFTDISPNSIMEISTDAVIDLAGSETSFPVTLGKADSFFEQLEQQGLRMLPDEYVAYLITSTGSGEFTWGVSWAELF